ncbi:MAG: N-acetylmuramoyl-L-alanine amidase [Spirochaetaceae bacterium]|nr:N-acetylmuramoyl-L-alanine amidase [Spirochaetaceae bacterium]
MGIKKVFVIFLLFLIIPYLSAQEIALDEFVRANNFVYTWSPFLNTGELRHGNNSFRFKVGEDFIVYNHREIISNSHISRKNGSLMLDAKTADVILRKTRVSAANVPTANVPPVNVPTTNVANTRVDNRNLHPSGYRVAAILIDPGHGGRDPGAIGRHTVNGKPFVINEKDIVLDIALELNRRLLARYNDKRIILSRRDDTFISLEDRVEIGNSFKLEENEAIIMVSIHANASLNRNARGFEVWHLPPEYRRNLIDATTIDNSRRDILHILNEMREEEFTIQSLLLAQNILAGLDTSIGGGDKELNRGLRERTWFVVRNAKMPSVLVEVGFVTNTEEAQQLANRAHLMKITEGIYNGIVKFIDNFETINFGGER